MRSCKIAPQRYAPERWKKACKTAVFPQLCGRYPETGYFLIVYRMRYVFFSIAAIVAVLCFLGASCNNPAPQPAEPRQAPAAAQELMPANADTAFVGFPDSNFYISNDAFCIASVVQSHSDRWQKFWVRIEILDASGKVLTINGDSSAIVRALSDAVPPSGATAFFCGFPLNQIGGTPARCRLTGAGAVSMPPGPIIIASGLGGVRVSYHKPEEDYKSYESEFKASGVIENPLDIIAPQFRVVALIYGKDGKLYFVQAIDPHAPGAPLQMERAGPLAPQEKRKILCPIHYQQLPQKLQDLLIQRVDFQVYEAR